METFPQSFKDLTVDFLNTALHSTLPEIASFTKSAEDVPQGFTGDVFRIDVTYATPTPPNSPHPSTLILKFATTNPGINALLTNIKGYRREITLYPILNAHPQLRTPALYHADISATNSTFLMILEDLLQKQLHRGNHETPLDFSLATRIVDYFAYMNATFWNCHLSENFKEYLAIGNNAFPAYMQKLTSNMYAKRLDAFIERTPAPICAQISRNAQSVTPAIGPRNKGFCTSILPIFIGDSLFLWKMVGSIFVNISKTILDRFLYYNTEYFISQVTARRSTTKLLLYSSLRQLPTTVRRPSISLPADVRLAGPL